MLRHYEAPESFVPAVMSGDLEFDIVLASPVLLSSLWAAERVAPMSDFFPPSFIDGFAATPLSGAGQDDQLWGLPDTAGFHLLLFYNRELVNTPPTDIDELADMAQNLTRANQWGLAVNSYDPLWLIPWLTPQRRWLIEEAGGLTLNLSSMEQALTRHQQFHQGPDAVAPAATYEQVRDLFLQGEIAMMIDGEWALAERDSP